MNITRTTNANGTYRYTVDGEVHYKASKRRYTHASLFTSPKDAIQFHSTQQAADKNKGYAHLGWVKNTVIEIIDGDTIPTENLNSAHECGFCTIHPPFIPGDKIPTNACPHWVHSATTRRTQGVSGPAKTLPVRTVRTVRDCPVCHRDISLYADGTFYRHGPYGAECTGSHQDATGDTTPIDA